jgi:HEAT repeat protein
VGARILADVLSQGCFPALQFFYLYKNPNLTDVGVVALAEALSKTTQTFLTNLNLSDVGMGDEGIGALACLISQGRMEQLEELSLSSNSGVTRQGIIALAEAIDARGLPKLRALNLDGLVRETDDETVLGLLLSCTQSRKGASHSKNSHLILLTVT